MSTEIENRVEDIEIDLLLEGIFRRWGYDFRSYSRSSLTRRLCQFLLENDHGSISGMIPRLLNDEIFFSKLVRFLSITVTEMFRDPKVYKKLRELVIPLFKTWPHCKVWHAGCATGEEVYSLAILLKEENVYGRTTIYATDINDQSIAKGQKGIYEAKRIKEATRNYQLAGGRQSFSEYYHSLYGAASMNADLKQRIVFSTHNLACDGAFGEMHLVFCRNVLIYFNRELQDMALRLFTDSLVHGGFLCLGTRETLRFSSVRDCYETVDETASIYKKRLAL